MAVRTRADMQRAASEALQLQQTSQMPRKVKLFATLPRLQQIDYLVELRDNASLTIHESTILWELRELEFLNPTAMPQQPPRAAFTNRYTQQRPSGSDGRELPPMLPLQTKAASVCVSNAPLPAPLVESEAMTKAEQDKTSQ